MSLKGGLASAMNGYLETMEEVFAAFPQDAEGNIIIEEIDLDKCAGVEPDPDIVARIEALETSAA